MAALSDSVDALAGAIAGRVRLMERQAAAGMDRVALMALQARAVAIDIAALAGKLTVDQAERLTAVITNGPWDDAQKLQLATAVAEAQAAAAPAGGAGGPRGSQKAAAIEKFFTMADWGQILSSELSEDAKLRVIAYRMIRLGISCANEALLMRASAMVCMQDPGITYIKKQAACKKLQGFTRGFDATMKWPFAHIRSYPLDPSHLAPDVYKYAFENDYHVLPQWPDDTPFIATASDMCYRDSHAGLKAEKLAKGIPMKSSAASSKAPTGAITPAGRPAMSKGGAAELQQMCGCLLQMMQMFSGAQQQRQPSSGGVIDLGDLRRPPKRQRSASADTLRNGVFDDNESPAGSPPPSGSQASSQSSQQSPGTVGFRPPHLARAGAGPRGGAACPPPTWRRVHQQQQHQQQPQQQTQPSCHRRCSSLSLTSPRSQTRRWSIMSQTMRRSLHISSVAQQPPQRIQHSCRSRPLQSSLPPTSWPSLTCSSQHPPIRSCSSPTRPTRSLQWRGWGSSSVIRLISFVRQSSP